MLDDFNRADGAPGANWVQAIAAYSVPPISGNALSWPQYPSAAWATPFAADQFASTKIVAPAVGCALLLRLTNEATGTETCYAVACQNQSPFPAELFKVVGGVITSLGYSNFVMEATDVYVKAQIVGNVITLFGSTDGVTWTQRQVWTDSSILGSGKIGVYAQNNGAGPYGKLDDFDGGVFTPDTPEPPPPTIELSHSTFDSVLAHLTIPAGVTRVWLSRRAGLTGDEVFVRGGVDLIVTPGTTLDLYDFEAPVGVPLTYFARGGNEVGDVSTTPSTDTIELEADPSDDPWLVDVGQPLNTQRVIVVSLAELAYSVPAAVHKVIGRRAPIVTSDYAQTPTFQLVFATGTDDEREQARATLGNAMPVLVRTPPEQGVGNLYLSVLGWTETRPSRLALHADRVFTVQAVQVDRPDPALFVPVTLIETYAGVLDSYDDYGDVRSSRESYAALLITYAAAPGGSTEPWPPDDA